MQILKLIIKKILFSVKYSLSVLKLYTSPNTKPYALRFYEVAPQPPVERITSWSLYENEEIIKCYNHFKDRFKKAVFLLDKESSLEYAIKKSLQEDPGQSKTYLEFGVWTGTSINFLSRFVDKTNIYGFDSFEGLREDWHGYHITSGTFNLNKKIPKLRKNVIPKVGIIQDTLPLFLSNEKPVINFMHIDTDTYETAKFILNSTKKYLSKNCIIVFDELYNFPGWDVGEYKALTETFTDNEYKFLGFALKGEQAVIQII
tara:strand:+ start:1233 stop:2009 length:777 start_codon:yes stop_codon:yes gene_type:complete